MNTLSLLRMLISIVRIGLALIAAPAIWRLIRRRPHSHDAIWAADFFLCLNRMSFLIDVMIVGGAMLRWCYATSIAAALPFGAVAWEFQRHDFPASSRSLTRRFMASPGRQYSSLSSICSSAAVWRAV